MPAKSRGGEEFTDIAAACREEPRVRSPRRRERPSSGRAFVHGTRGPSGGAAPSNPLDATTRHSSETHSPTLAGSGKLADSARSAGSQFPHVGSSAGSTTREGTESGERVTAGTVDAQQHGRVDPEAPKPARDSYTSAPRVLSEVVPEEDDQEDEQAAEQANAAPAAPLAAPPPAPPAAAPAAPPPPPPAAEPASPSAVKPPAQKLPVSHIGASQLAAFAPFVDSPNTIMDLCTKAAQAFNLFDLDCSGTVAVEDLGAVLQSLGCDIGASKLQQLVGNLDAGMPRRSSDVFTLDEFFSFVLRHSRKIELCNTEQGGWLRRIRGLLKEHAPGGDGGDQVMSEDQRRNKSRMLKKTKEMSKSLWLPDTQHRRVWDMFVLWSLWVTFAAIPWRTFVLRAAESSGGWLALDVLCVVVFIADIFVFLNTAQLDQKANRLVTSRVAIILRNFNTVVLDVASSLPLDLFLLSIGSPFAVYASFHSLRLLKVVKVNRLFQRSGRLPMDGAYVTFYFHYLPIVLFFFWFVLGIHYLTLIKILCSTSSAGCNLVNEAACGNLTLAQCASSQDAKCGPLYDLDDPAEQEFSRMLVVWCSELFWVWTLLTTAPAPLPLRNTMQYVYSWILMTIALVLQGVLVGKMSVLVLKDSVSQQAADRMRGTLAILRHYKLPLVLQQEILSYQFHAIQQSAVKFAESLDKLPESMQLEIELYMKLETLSSVKMFSKASMPCKIRLVHSLQPFLAVPDQYIIKVGDIGEEMFFLVHGYADVIIPTGALVATLSPGDAFGEVALLSTDCKRTASIRALTFCDLLRLERHYFLLCLLEFPEFRSTVQIEMKSRGISDEQRREFTRNLFAGRGDAMQREATGAASQQGLFPDAEDGLPECEPEDPREPQGSPTATHGGTTTDSMVLKLIESASQHDDETRSQSSRATRRSAGAARALARRDSRGLLQAQLGSQMEFATPPGGDVYVRPHAPRFDLGNRIAARVSVMQNPPSPAQSVHERYASHNRGFALDPVDWRTAKHPRSSKGRAEDNGEAASPAHAAPQPEPPPDPSKLLKELRQQRPQPQPRAAAQLIRSSSLTDVAAGDGPRSKYARGGDRRERDSQQRSHSDEARSANWAGGGSRPAKKVPQPPAGRPPSPPAGAPLAVQASEPPTPPLAEGPVLADSGTDHHLTPNESQPVSPVSPVAHAVVEVDMVAAGEVQKLLQEVEDDVDLALESLQQRCDALDGALEELVTGYMGGAHPGQAHEGGVPLSDPRQAPSSPTTPAAYSGRHASCLTTASSRLPLPPAACVPSFDALQGDRQATPTSNPSRLPAATAQSNNKSGWAGLFRALEDQGA
eukprot:TRINITY_DN9309_c0_g1_i1.p1 TRINITY_DN9309_c0_g1~~TRINITY_DN9309_c0_g1_i1.p1  ORF type:complete len:1381 (+),score=388.13 TRINITY_DN9309_c0_g1_i1:147-4145(+)